MPTPPLVVDGLTDLTRPDAVGILFEYIAMTQGANGLPLPTSVEQLPASLRAECERPEVTYAPPGVLLVACDDDAVLGCVGLQPLRIPGTAECKRLYVRPAHRRAGVARLLMAAVHERAERAGFTRVVLDVMPGRVEAIAFYRRLGYTDTEPFVDWTFPMVYLEHPIGRGAGPV